MTLHRRRPAPHRFDVSARAVVLAVLCLNAYAAGLVIGALL